eukprot:Awhi_evm1s2835
MSSLLFSVGSTESINIDDGNVADMCRRTSLNIPRSSSDLSFRLCKGNSEDVCNTEYYECVNGVASTAVEVPDGMVCFEGELISTFTECLRVEELDEDLDDIFDAEVSGTAAPSAYVSDIVDEPIDEDEEGGSNTGVIAGAAAAGGLLLLAGAGGIIYKATGAGVATSTAVIDTTGPLTTNAANPLATNTLIEGENTLFSI